MLVDNINNKAVNSIILDPPDVVQLSNISCFYIMNNHNEYQLLEFENYVKLKDSITIKSLKKDRIGVLYINADNPHYKWRVYDCIVYETYYNDRMYVLNSGLWYEINREYAVDIDNKIRRYADNKNTILPENLGLKKEPDYNKQVANDINYTLFDGKIVYWLGRQLEFCDLFSNNKHIIHVKRRDRTKNISHVINQAASSAYVFLTDEKFRGKIHEIIDKYDDIDDSVKELLPINGVNPSLYTIVVAILLENRHDWPKSLPFLTKVHFVHTFENVRLWRYQVKLIPVLY